jgi:archaeal flagellar protein FlaI
VAFPAQVLVNNARVRRILGVTEILGVDAGTKELLTNDIFRWEPTSDQFLYLGRSFVLEHIQEKTGRTIDTLLEELRRKERYLTQMEKNQLSFYKDVSHAIAEYYVEPAEALARLEKQVAR